MTTPLTDIERTPQFKRDYRKYVRKHYDTALLAEAVETIMRQDMTRLSSKYRDHALTGNWKGYRELHILGDWLLIYKIKRNTLTLVLTRTGSHDELF